jgi:beta-lactamase regulating signal transducer with metallopeptidase domain
MKKISKKRLNQIENKIIKILDTKVSICSVIWIIIVLILFSLLFNKKPSYYYIDNNNNSGHSSNCYETSDKLICETQIEVKQFYKN